MCVDGAGHDQTCKSEKGCIFSPKYAGIAPFQQQCRAAFGVTPEQTFAAVAFNSLNYGDNHPGTIRSHKTCLVFQSNLDSDSRPPLRTVRKRNEDLIDHALKTKSCGYLVVMDSCLICTTFSTGGSRIVFVNGDIDPFHYGTFTHCDISQALRIIFD